MITLYAKPNFRDEILTFDPKNVKYIYKYKYASDSGSFYKLTDTRIKGFRFKDSGFFQINSVKNESDDFFLVIKQEDSNEIRTVQGSVNDTGFDFFVGYFEIFKKKRNCTEQIKTYKIVIYLFISLSVAIILILGVLVYIGQVQLYTTMTPLSYT